MNISFWDYANSYPVTSLIMIVVIALSVTSAVKEIALAIAYNKKDDEDETDSKV